MRSRGGNPLAVGELRAADPAAPTVLIYGHYDVQGPGRSSRGPRRRSSRDPRRAPLRARRGRRQGQLPAAAARRLRDGARRRAARERAGAGRGRGGDAPARRWPTGCARTSARADAAIVFDSGMPDPQTPAITVGLRGIVMTHARRCASAERNLHSGMYGGSVLNALHVLHGAARAGAPGRRRARARGAARGRPRRRRRPSSRPGSGCRRATHAIARGRRAPGQPGRAAPSSTSAPARDAVARRQRDRRRRAAHGRAGGRARVGLAAPRRRARIPSGCAPCSRGCCATALPAGAELELESHLRDAGALRPRRAGAARSRRRRSSARAASRRRSRASGGSIPIVAEMAARGYPVIVGGFGLPDDAIHAPDESFALRSLELGRGRGARALPRARLAAARLIGRAGDPLLREPLLEHAGGGARCRGRRRGCRARGAAAGSGDRPGPSAPPRRAPGRPPRCPTCSAPSARGSRRSAPRRRRSAARAGGRSCGRTCGSRWARGS